MKSWFLKRDYPQKLVESEMKNLKFSIQEKNC